MIQSEGAAYDGLSGIFATRLVESNLQARNLEGWVYPIQRGIRNSEVRYCTGTVGVDREGAQLPPCMSHVAKRYSPACTEYSFNNLLWNPQFGFSSLGLFDWIILALSASSNFIGWSDCHTKKISLSGWLSGFIRHLPCRYLKYCSCKVWAEWYNHGLYT